jgi:hypothetical protein
MESVALRALDANFRDLSTMLTDAGEISLLTVMDDVGRKTMLVSAASYFEVGLVEIVQEFCARACGANTLIPSIVTAKAIKRQYHTWFDWEKPNANSFFSMFGPDFKRHMQEKIAASSDMERQISAFMEIGRERNRLVHGDYANYTVEKTAREIYALYLDALEFVKGMPGELDACVSKLREAAGA